MPYTLPPGTWEQIKKVGQIDTANEEANKQWIEKAIEACKRSLRASRETERLVQQLRDAVSKAFTLLQKVRVNEEFLYVGTSADGTDGVNCDHLVDGAEGLHKIEIEMKRAQARFEGARSYRPLHMQHVDASQMDKEFRGKDLLGFDRWDPLADLAESLLIFQGNTRGRPPPIAPGENASNPRFVEFVYLCAKAADPSLVADYRDKRNDKIDRAIRNAILSNRIIRDYDQEYWPEMWE